MPEPLQDKPAESVDHANAAAQSIASAAERAKDSADRRRTRRRPNRAAERTYAAWVRTGLVALASGIGARKLLEGVVPSWMVIAAGTALVLFSGFCFIAGVWRQIFVGAPPPNPDVPRLPPYVLAVLNAFLALVALAALLGIWFGRSL